MSHNVTFEDLFINILRDYYDTFGGDPLNVDYKITDNIVDEYAKLRPYHVAKEPEKIQTLSAYNGMTVCPTSVGGTFTILINRAFVMQYIGQNNMTWVGTIIHETTHVRDYIDYAHLISATDYEDILNINKNLPFQLWTEFNARARVYYFVRKYTFENMFDKTQINDIVQIELPGQEELLYKNYHQTQDGVQQAYYVSHFLGRLYTLQEIFPDYFTDEWIEAYPLFENNEWMYKWYLFLKKNADLKSAFENFDEMKKILRQNFSWI